MREETEKSVAFNHHRADFLGLLVTLGIVFGDIGTSPLYVMKAIESYRITPEQKEYLRTLKIK